MWVFSKEGGPLERNQDESGLHGKLFRPSGKLSSKDKFAHSHNEPEEDKNPLKPKVEPINPTDDDPGADCGLAGRSRLLAGVDGCVDVGDESIHEGTYVGAAGFGGGTGGGGIEDVVGFEVVDIVG